MGSSFALKAANVVLRVASLASKLLLSLYMGRYLGLSDLGVYGLVFSSVTLSTVVLGVRMDYVVGRDVVGLSWRETVGLLRDQALFYGANYLVFGAALLAIWGAGLAGGFVLAVIFVLSVLENASATLAVNLVSMGRPVFATVLFFLRSGLWSLFIVIAGVLAPSLRTVEAVFVAWGFGEAVCFVLALWALRHKAWREAARAPVDWRRLRGALVISFPVWLGTIGWSLSLSLDRFVVSRFMDLEHVGVLTFYSSFSIALLSLAQSGVYTFSYPQLIRFHKERNAAAFKKEAWRMEGQAATFVLVLALLLGWGLPFAAPFFNKPEFAQQAPTLWLLLFSVWIRAHADSLHYVLYARGLDRPLWLGGLLMLIPAFLGNLVLVPKLGLIGAGYSAVLANLFLLVWRLAFVMKKNHETKGGHESICEKTAENLDP